VIVDMCLCVVEEREERCREERERGVMGSGGYQVFRELVKSDELLFEPRVAK
jgi:hypothetical protein